MLVSTSPPGTAVASRSPSSCSPVSPRRSAVRLHRSRLAFAVAVTLAAVPVLVLDNMSATAETNEHPVEVVVRLGAQDGVGPPRAA